MGRSLLSSPFNSTSAALLFWFLLWFACILAFSFQRCVDVASLELTFGCFDCFVRRLFPLLRLPFAVVFSSCRLGRKKKQQYRNWNFCDKDRCPPTSVPPKKIDISSSKSVNSNEIEESSSQSEQSLKVKPFPLFTKSLSSMKRTSTHDTIISWQRWLKVCGPLGKPICD